MLNDFTAPQISPELRERIENISAKRPKTVLNHILQYGYVTTDELNKLYGYNHPPRAARDVRENGIKLTTIKVKGPDGRTIGAYVLADDISTDTNKEGRRAFPKSLKIALLNRDGQQCALCNGKFPANTLQIDHKVPYEVAGDVEGELDPSAYMLLCNSCNRSKSWTCEHCDNWKGKKIAIICNTCIFGSPNRYEHIATRQMRQLTITWNEQEIQYYNKLQMEATKADKPIYEYIKDILKLH